MSINFRLFETSSIFSNSNLGFSSRVEFELKSRFDSTLLDFFELFWCSHMPTLYQDIKVGDWGLGEAKKKERGRENERMEDKEKN